MISAPELVEFRSICGNCGALHTIITHPKQSCSNLQKLWLATYGNYGAFEAKIVPNYLYSWLQGGVRVHLLYIHQTRIFVFYTSRGFRKVWVFDLNSANFSYRGRFPARAGDECSCFTKQTIGCQLLGRRQRQWYHAMQNSLCFNSNVIPFLTLVKQYAARDGLVPGLTFFHSPLSTLSAPLNMNLYLQEK